MYRQGIWINIRSAQSTTHIHNTTEKKKQRKRKRGQKRITTSTCIRKSCFLLLLFCSMHMAFRSLILSFFTFSYTLFRNIARVREHTNISFSHSPSLAFSQSLSLFLSIFVSLDLILWVSLLIILSFLKSSFESVLFFFFIPCVEFFSVVYLLVVNILLQPHFQDATLMNIVLQ